MNGKDLSAELEELLSLRGIEGDVAMCTFLEILFNYRDEVGELRGQVSELKDLIVELSKKDKTQKQTTPPRLSQEDIEELKLTMTTSLKDAGMVVDEISLTPENQEKISLDIINGISPFLEGFLRKEDVYIEELDKEPFFQKAKTTLLNNLKGTFLAKYIK